MMMVASHGRLGDSGRSEAPRHNEDYAADIVFAAVIEASLGPDLVRAAHRGWDALFRRGGFVCTVGSRGVAAVSGSAGGGRLPRAMVDGAHRRAFGARYALGRVGCFLVNDDYGIPSTLRGR